MSPTLGPDARAALAAVARDADAEVARAEAALARWLAAPAPRAALARDTEVLHAALLALRDADRPIAAHAREALPLVAGLAEPGPALVEHAPPPAGTVARPLLDHATRAVEALARLERGEPLDPTLTAGRAPDAALADVRAADLLPAVRIALVHLDIAKGGDPATRRARAAAGVNLDVHNLGGEDLLSAPAALDGFGLDAASIVLVRALVAHHGLAGQFLRGETPAETLATWNTAAPSLPAAAGAARQLVDLCDTAAVRPGLVDDALFDRFAVLHVQLARGTPPRPTLADRLRALRASRVATGEDPSEVDRALAALSDDERTEFDAALGTCQLWYAESATAGLSPAGQLRVFAAAIGAARRDGLSLEAPWHAQLAPLVARLHGDDARSRYRRRVVEACLATASVRALLRGEPVPGPLGTLAGRLGRDRAITLDWRSSDEADALVTLLSIYETKSSAAFHATLKALCDLYGLRKDEFDRVANEAAYLATMNAARDDKARMLDHVVPGVIVEVGPGGGVVLDLLEARFPTSQIVGIDASAEVVAALSTRRARQGRRWTIRAADAFDLPALFAPGSVDTVVCCSLLHEIYSYVERPGDDGSPPRRFRIEAVRDLVRAAFATLRVGGRLVIRDGVAPPAGRRRLQFLAADARPMLDLFVAQFEGRHIEVTELPDGRVEMSTPDAMEFLYTYTWGPASFPYEVREQYGVLPYAAYAEALVAWCGGAGAARVVPLPAAEASYLQPGYVDHLARKVALTDEHDHPVALPDSNALWVIERGGAVAAR